MDLAQRPKPKPTGKLEQFSQLFTFQSFGDQQDKIRAVNQRFEDLITIDDEILAQNGRTSVAADLRDELQIAPEIMRLGKHRKGARTCIFVLHGKA